MKKTILMSSVFLFFTSLCFSGVIKVKSPAGGVNWKKGINHTIIWTSTGCQGKDVRINIYKSSSIRGKYVLQLTGKNTGSKSWTIPSNFADGEYIIRIKTNPAERGCSGESGVFNIGPLKTSTQTLTYVPLKTTQMKPPDLKIEITSIPTEPDINQKTIVKFNVRNIGPTKSKATVMRAFKANQNAGTSNVPELNPGESFDKSIVYRPPGAGWVLFTGNVDQKWDANQGDNTASLKIFSKGPDLVVAFNKGARWPVLTSAWVYGYIKNIGAARSSPCKIKIYLKKKGNKKYNVPALDPGQVYEVIRKETFVLDGSKTVRMTIDSENQVVEERENNNTIESEIYIFGLFTNMPSSHIYVCSNGKTGSTLNDIW